VLASVLAGCQRHRLDPFVYLRDGLTRLSDYAADRLDDFLPDRRAATTKESVTVAATNTPAPATPQRPGQPAAPFATD
jgi:IS66 C-terminal element